MKSQRATEKVAERQRSRSEVDTGRRIGQCFGLNLLAVLFAGLWEESE